MKQITFKTDEKIKAIAELASYIDSLEAGKVYTVTVEPQKKRRSLDANSFAWLMLDKIAACIHESKTEIYRSYIKEIGGNSDTVQMQAETPEELKKRVERLRDFWALRGLGWQSDIIESDKPTECSVVLYYGSSAYNSEQMSRLIEMIVQDCETFGIETKDPAELEMLVKEWGVK